MTAHERGLALRQPSRRMSFEPPRLSHAAPIFPGFLPLLGSFGGSASRMGPLAIDSCRTGLGVGGNEALTMIR
jgi:hypothetical protein